MINKNVKFKPEFLHLINAINFDYLRSSKLSEKFIIFLVFYNVSPIVNRSFNIYLKYEYINPRKLGKECMDFTYSLKQLSF